MRTLAPILLALCACAPESRELHQVQQLEHVDAGRDAGELELSVHFDGLEEHR